MFEFPNHSKVTFDVFELECVNFSPIVHFLICYLCYSSHPSGFLVYRCLFAKGGWASEF
jgi:hypothetical protein